MTLKQIFKKHDFLRLSCLVSWLVYEEYSDEFVVYKRAYNQKASRVIYRGKDEKIAIEILTTD